MRFSWQAVNLFGIAMQVPMLRFLIRKSEEQMTAFSQVAAELNACDKCHKYTNYARANSMLQHLIDAHSIEEDRALQIVSDLWKHIFILAPRGRQNQEIIARYAKEATSNG